MAEVSTIARPYAEALFAAAVAAGRDTAAQWQPAIESLSGLLAQPAVREGLSNPGLSDRNRYELIVSLFGSPLPGPVAELLRLALENGRLVAFGDIAAQFHDLKNAADGQSDCLIESAFPMSAEEVASLVAALSRKFPNRLQPELRVNPQLIGGVRVTVGDHVLDSSVRARLEAMQARLTA
jgi:F-type H+-transporting ATPase subunit delta